MSDAISVGALIKNWRAIANDAKPSPDDDRDLDVLKADALYAEILNRCADELAAALQLQVGAEARTGGGWQPEPEVCICAAIRTKDGAVVRGHRHPDCFANLSQRTPKPEMDHDAPWQGQGFVTSRNRFVDRAEGMRLMAAAGAFSAHTGLSLAGTKDGTPLFSEDLY